MKLDRAFSQFRFIPKLAIILVFFCNTSNGQLPEEKQHSVFFNSAQYYPEYTEWLQLDNFLTQLPESEVFYRVVGHADVVGSDLTNDTLAKARARVVVRHLLEAGVSPKDIRFSSVGEHEPVNLDGYSAVLSRRVEVTATAKNTPTTSNHSTKQFAGTLVHNCMVDPPLPAAELPIERFSFPASEKQEIRVSGGSILLVPATAFVNSNGELAEGNINLSYEDFHDRAEVFLSGIPMKYDSLGKKLPMESYGMFRILASNDQGALNLAPGKKIRLEFVSSSSSNNVNFYFLDPFNQKWNHLGKAELMATATNANTGSSVSLAVRKYLELTETTQPAVEDTLGLSGRFYSNQHLGEQPVAARLRLLRDGTLREKRIFKKLMKDRPRFQLKFEPLRAGEDRNWVKFTLKDSHLNGTQNRAWKTAFKNHVWQYNGSLRRSAFIQKYRDMVFQDLRISLNETTDDVYLELKNLDGIERISLMKITRGELDADMYRQVYGELLDATTKRALAKKESQFEKRFHVYQAQLKLRQRRLNKEMERQNRLELEGYQRDLEWAWEEARQLMLPSELAMTMLKWETYCAVEGEKQQRAEEIEFATKTTVVRQLEISKCGIYNCDRIKDLVSPQFVTANFVANGEVLNWYQAYVFDENLNSFLLHSSLETTELSMDPEALLGLIVIDMNGNHFYLQKEDVMAMNHGGKPLRIMNLQPLDPRSGVEDIRQLLSMGF